MFNKLGVAGNIYSAGANKSLAEVQYTGMGVAMMMQKYLPLLSFMLFAIMTGAFPFIFAFALLPGGYKSIVNYVKTLAWVSLWGPMAAILNFFVDRRLGEIYSKVTASGDYTTLLEPAHIVADISSAGGEMAGLAGMLFLSVPGLSWMLVSGSGVMLGNIAGIIGGSFTKNISPDAVMQDATQLQAAKEASIQMDKRVGVAEMAEFAARRQAATEGGAYSGARKAMAQGGFGMSEFGRMAEVQSASEVGQAAAFANQVGNGTNAAMAGAIQGAQAGAQTMATANTIGSTSNAAMIGTITGTQAASAALAHARKIGSAEEAARVGRVEGGAKAGGEIGQANAYNGSADAAFDTNRKAVLGSETQKRTHFQQLSDNQVATNAAHRGFLSGRTEAELANKLSSDPSMYQKEVYQAEVNANKEVSQFDSADTAVRGLSKKNGISLSNARNAIATVARNSAATQIAGEAATALGEKNAIGGSLASAMMANSVEMGLWNGTQSGANAHMLEGRSLDSEKTVAFNEMNHHGLGAVFGEYDKWQKINAEGNAVKKKIAAEKSHLKKEISDIKDGMGETAKKEAQLAQNTKKLEKDKIDMLNNGSLDKIKAWSNEFQKLEAEKKQLEADKKAALDEYTNFMQHRAEYQEKHGSQATLAKQQELLHNMQSADQALKEIDSKEARIKELTSQEKAVDQALTQNKNVYNPENFGAKKYVQTVKDSSEGAVHNNHIATSAQNARAIGNLDGSITDAKGEEILYRNRMGATNHQMGEQIAVDSIGSVANKVVAAQNMSSIFQGLYNQSGIRTKEMLSDMGFGTDAIHNMSAFSGMRNTAINTVLNGKDAYATLNAETNSFGSHIFTQQTGINIKSVHNVDYGQEMIQGITGDWSIDAQETAATGISVFKDAASVAVSVGGGGKIFNAAKHIGNNGLTNSLKNIGNVYKSAGQNILNDTKGLFKEAGEAEKKMETIGVRKGQIGGGG